MMKFLIAIKPIYEKFFGENWGSAMVWSGIILLIFVLTMLIVFAIPNFAKICNKIFKIISRNSENIEDIFDEKNAEDIKRSPAVIIIVALIVCAIIFTYFGFVGEKEEMNQRNQAYENMVDHPMDYNIYLNGEKVSEEFDIKALEYDNYSVRIDGKNIYLNEYVPIYNSIYRRYWWNGL